MNLKEFDSVSDRFAYVNKCFTDHETRNNANHNEEEPAETPTESTPLMHRFPVNEPVRSPLTTVIVSLLLIILIAGVIIGIYLLVLQNDSGEFEFCFGLRNKLFSNAFIVTYFKVSMTFICLPVKLYFSQLNLFRTL